ncbi:hypothetical protein DL770_009804 [Monosporascus sp. CRB-9-2]|nr:hypothetical protein DL770_009804 [Monosporascus sp. CRB-9-2]
MQFTSLVFISLLAGLGAAIPADSQPIAEWSVWNTTRRRNDNNTVCEWNLTIEDDKSGRPAETCQFTVEATEKKPCDQVQFRGIPCSAESDWVMNGGHSDYQDFMVVVVYNVREKAKAYFGFPSQDLNKGRLIPKKIEPAYPASPQA